MMKTLDGLKQECERTLVTSCRKLVDGLNANGSWLKLSMTQILNKPESAGMIGERQESQQRVEN